MNRVEVMSGPERRRRWSEEQKQAMSTLIWRRDASLYATLLADARFHDLLLARDLNPEIFDGVPG